MIKTIAGMNASGKTRYLEGEYTKSLEEGIDCVSNLHLNAAVNKEVDDEVVSLFNDYLKIITLGDDGSCTWLAKEASPKFLELIRLLILKTEIVFLDEPELGLSVTENNNIIQALTCLSRLRTVYLTTHHLDYCDFDELYKIGSNGDLEVMQYEDLDCF